MNEYIQPIEEASDSNWRCVVISNNVMAECILFENTQLSPKLVQMTYGTPLLHHALAAKTYCHSVSVRASFKHQYVLQLSVYIDFLLITIQHTSGTQVFVVTLQAACLLKPITPWLLTVPS